MNQLQSSYVLNIICRLKHPTRLTIIWQDSLLAKCEVARLVAMQLQVVVLLLS